jgi:hypothetical protein
VATALAARPGAIEQNTILQWPPPTAPIAYQISGRTASSSSFCVVQFICRHVEKEAARQSRHPQGTGSLLAVSSGIPPANIWLDNGSAFS